MVKEIKWIKPYIMKLSLQERVKQEKQQNLKIIKYYRKMSDIDLKLEYIKIKSNYEYKKNMLGLFLVTLIVAIISDVWKSFFSFIQMAISYNSLYMQNSKVVTEVSFYIALILSIFIISIITVFLVSFMRNIRKLNKTIMLIELVKEEKCVKN